MVANFITETLNTKNPKDEQQPQNTHDNDFLRTYFKNVYNIQYIDFFKSYIIMFRYLPLLCDNTNIRLLALRKQENTFIFQD